MLPHGNSTNKLKSKQGVENFNSEFVWNSGVHGKKISVQTRAEKESLRLAEDWENQETSKMEIFLFIFVTFANLSPITGILMLSVTVNNYKHLIINYFSDQVLSISCLQIK